MAGVKSSVDWERIEPGWRAGVKSVLQLAEEYEAETSRSISHTAINKHFRKLGVPRDLSAKVQAKAEAMVSAAMVSGIVSTETTATDAQIINQAATTVATVLLSERKDIHRYRTLCQTMLAELEAESQNPELFAGLGEMLQSENSTALHEAYRKAISLPQRIDGVKKLADTLKTLIALERQAYGIADTAEPDDTNPITANPREIARRIAHALSIGLRAVEAPPIPGTPQQQQWAH